jgi:endonuclease YncB( thermonuclease family)
MHPRADDADILTVNGKVYRLDGIDAPEIDQSLIAQAPHAVAQGRCRMTAA